MHCQNNFLWVLVHLLHSSGLSMSGCTTETASCSSQVPIKGRGSNWGADKSLPLLWKGICSQRDSFSIQKDDFSPLLNQCFLIQWWHISTIQRIKRYLTVKNKSQLLSEASPSAAFISNTFSTPMHDLAQTFDVHRAALEQKCPVLERGSRAELHIHTLGHAFEKLWPQNIQCTPAASIYTI